MLRPPRIQLYRALYKGIASVWFDADDTAVAISCWPTVLGGLYDENGDCQLMAIAAAARTLKACSMAEGIGCVLHGKRNGGGGIRTLVPKQVEDHIYTRRLHVNVGPSVARSLTTAGPSQSCVLAISRLTLLIEHSASRRFISGRGSPLGTVLLVLSSHPVAEAAGAWELNVLSI